MILMMPIRHEHHDNVKFTLCVMAALVVLGLFLLSFHL